MTQRSRPQADNNATVAYTDSGPYSGDQWRERIYAAHTGDENTASQRTRLRGVVPTFDNLLVCAIAGDEITVGTGAGIIYGSYLFNSALVTFAPDVPAANPRIDLVCMVENNTNAAVDDGVAAEGWVFPNDLSDYDATPGIGPYSARLVIVKGTEGAGEPNLDVSNTLFMVPIFKYQIADVTGALSLPVDRREFVDIEQIVGVDALENDTIEDALIIGTQVTNGVGADDLGVGIRAKLENDNGDLEDAGQLAIRWTDATNASEDSRLELRLSSTNAFNLSGVINAPTAASADGNARGVGAVDLQQNRQVITEVASGTYSFLAAGVENTASGDYAGAVAGAENVASGEGAFVAGGFLNTASGDYSHVTGYDNTASGNNSNAEGRGNTSTGNASHAEGYETDATADYAHSEGYQTSASIAAAHAEGNGTIASQTFAHAEGGATTASAAGAHSEGQGTTASGGTSHAEGSGTTASGTGTHAEGYQTTASGDYTHSGGVSSVSSKYSQFARSSGLFAAAGDAQYSDYHLFRSVTHSDANWYYLYLGIGGARLTIAADQVVTFDALIVGTTQGCTKSFAFRVVGIIENDGGTTSLLASTVTTIYDADDTDFDARASADDPNDALLIEVTDSTSGGDIVRWSAVVRCAEVTFPA